MVRCIHWLLPNPDVSGMYSYTYQLHFKAKELGYDSHICFFNHPKGTKFRFKTMEGEASSHGLALNAINVLHDQTPIYPLDNMVAELHGMPQWVTRGIEPLSATCYMLARCQLLLTRFPSHVPYWQELTNKKIHVMRPGVDLNFWKPSGKAVEFTHRPMVLWAESWRDGIKEPWDLLYAMKIVNRAIPSATLKLVNIPEEKRQILAYFIGRLGLDSVIEWPLEGGVRNMDELYRGCDILYCPVNEEGDNVAWEAESCGLPVIYKKESAQEIAQAIIEQEAKHERSLTRHDIADTVKSMMGALMEQFDSDSEHTT